MGLLDPHPVRYRASATNRAVFTPGFRRQKRTTYPEVEPLTRSRTPERKFEPAEAGARKDVEEEFR